MLIASCTLLALTGPGPEALRIMLSPLSWVVGFGFIGMETLYYLMLWYVTPAEASVLTRLGIPLAMVMGVVIHGRRPRRRAIWGAMIVRGRGRRTVLDARSGERACPASRWRPAAR